MKAHFAGALLWILATALTVWAQVDTATVTGTVRDTTGAVVTNATVTATETDTGIRSATKSNAAGNYVITPLKIGRYSVSVEAAGFRPETHQGIVLDVQQNLRVDFALHVGTVAQTADVSGAPPLVDTETAALGNVIVAQQVEELPLNGRRYTDLAELTSGVAKVTEGPVNGGSTPTNGNAGGSFAVNGTRGAQNDFILDGVDNVSNDNADVAILSSVDAIAEFKIQTSNYSPEFGRSGGAVINATTKSGTNNFHGSVWEFLRNDALDARGFFESPTDRKAPYKQNQFGATLGGPIKRDKAFFFVDYEGTRISQAQTNIVSVPTDGTNGTSNERIGDFSGVLGSQSMLCGADGASPCVDALGRPIFTNEIFDPATLRTTTGPNCPPPPAVCYVRDGFGFDKTTGQPIPGQANIIPSTYPGFSSVGLGYAALYPAPNQPGTANNYLVNSPGTDQVDQMDAKVDENVTSSIALFQRFSLTRDNRFQAPVFSGIADGGNYNTGNRPLNAEGFVLGLTHTINPHITNSARVGFNRVHYISNSPVYGQKYPPPSLQVPGVPNDTLTNGLTWFAPAAYAGLGEPLFTPTRSTSQGIQLDDTLSLVHGKHLIRLGPQIHFNQFNLLQIGQPRGNLSFSGQFTSAIGSLADGSGNGLADMLLGFPVTSVISTVTYFGNRQRTYGAFVEDQFQATPQLSIDYGLRWDYATPLYEANNRESNFDYTKGIIVPAGTPGYPARLATSHKDDFAPRLGLSYKPLRSKPFVIRAGYGRFFSFYEIRTGDPLQLAYNLPFFYEPTFNSDGITTSDVTLARGFPPLNPANAPLAGVTSQDFNPETPVYDQWNVNLEYQLPGQIVISPAYVGTKGTHLQVLRDLNQIPTPQPTFNQDLSPYPQYGTFTSIENRGNSTYHAFQLKAEKRTSHGLYFLSAFTFGKAINDQPEICCNSPWPQNSYNIRAEKGLADFDNRERWVTSLDYELPVGKGRRFLNQGGALDAVLGGWHLGGIITLRSGFPFSPQIGFDPSNTGSPGLQRSNQTGSGHLANPTPTLWFNLNDFPAPNCPNGCFGNAGKNILEGPGEKTADLSLRKFFSFTEQKNLEFRAEFFNAFNHAVFSQPDPTVTDGPGAAGVITSTVIPQRQIQFALKFHF